MIQTTSIQLQPYITYPPQGTPLFQIPVIGNQAMGAGYYKTPNPLHTVQFSTSASFIGIVALQGSLASYPSDTDSDWYDIPETILGDGINVVPDNSYIFTFGGNHVWVRSIIKVFSQGAITQILYSHN